MFFLQKPKFHRSRDLISNSRKKMSRTNYFPWQNSFPSAMSHIRTSTKMGFPGIEAKMLELHDHITSSKMVVRGWYMTHFDRRDLLNSKKQVWGGFRNLPDLRGPICEFSRFFWKFRSGPRILEKWFFWLQSPKKMFENWFFSSFIFFPKNTILELHFGMFTSGILLIHRVHEFFEILTSTFPD